MLCHLAGCTVGRWMMRSLSTISFITQLELPLLLTSNEINPRDLLKTLVDVSQCNSVEVPLRTHGEEVALVFARFLTNGSSDVGEFKTN